MPKSRCRFLVPTHYNDGKPVEPDFFIWLKNELTFRFGAFRWIAPEEGVWKGQVEFTIEYEVAVLPKRIPELRSVVLEIGRRLGQKAMYFDAPAPSVEIIDTETGKEIDDEDDEELEDQEENDSDR